MQRLCFHEDVSLRMAYTISGSAYIDSCGKVNKIFVQEGMNVTLECSPHVWGGSRKLVNAILDMSRHGRGSYDQSFLLHVADSYNLKVSLPWLMWILICSI